MKEEGKIEAGPGDAAANPKMAAKNKSRKGIFVLVHFALSRGYSVGQLGGWLPRDKMTLGRLRFRPEDQGQIGADMTNPGQSQSKSVKPICEWC